MRFGLILSVGFAWFGQFVAADVSVVSFEAEAFFEQDLDDVRAWYVVEDGSIPRLSPDPDPAHLEGASGSAYIEALPDTRRTHADKLIHGENFAPEPGKMAILKYRASFPVAGRYYVWARVFSTGTEDNGFHIGLNGEWPESGRRWQTVVKRRWHWECKQRTAKVHSGVPMQLYLDVPSAGEHEVWVSMREDGCELDRFILATDIAYRPPGYSREAGGSQKLAKVDRVANGKGAVSTSGEKRVWHKITTSVDGPWAHESDPDRNPFTDIEMWVIYTHESGNLSYRVPGYFAADGRAGETSAVSGRIWRAHLSPDLPGQWQYRVELREAKSDKPLPGDGQAGSFVIKASDKAAPDLRGRGRLEYVGERYLKFAGDQSYFLKAGPDAPETFLAYEGFDGTRANSPGKGPLKTWQPHLRDWRDGDPSWKGDRGKGIIGAVNYLSDQGLNAFSFLTYNAGGDGDNIWPFVDRGDKMRYDVSKLDQWGMVFDHASSRGLYLHFKLQETEIDDNRRGKNNYSPVATSLDGGLLGPERRLYLREIIARYGYHLALNWNLGEENTQSPDEQRAMADYVRQIDPYDHHIVIHTYPDQQDRVYSRLIGDQSVLTGASLQNPWHRVHQRTLHWLREADAAGKVWVVANDEQNPADLGVPPDPGYQGFSGKATKDGKSYDLHDIRRDTLWGNLMAGGAGVEYYFGYKLPENDLRLNDFRSREQSWGFCRTALGIFHDSGIPFWEMQSADHLVGNSESANRRPWCLAKPGEVYLIYTPDGKAELDIDLTEVDGEFAVQKYDPTGSDIHSHDLERIKAGGKVRVNYGGGEAAVVIKKIE